MDTNQRRLVRTWRRCHVGTESRSARPSCRSIVVIRLLDLNTNERCVMCSIDGVAGGVLVAASVVAEADASVW